MEAIQCSKLYYVLANGYNVDTKKHGIFYVNKKKGNVF